MNYLANQDANGAFSLTASAKFPKMDWQNFIGFIATG
jgi:hypothetical protein